MKILMIVLGLYFVLHLSATIINIPADQPTIQAGLDIAIEGDTVLVSSGTYYENIIWSEINGIILISELGAEETIIDGNYISNTIIIGDGGTATIDTTTIIDGFSIRNGNSSDSFGGSGIYANFANPVIQNCIIYNNFGESNGAILHQGSKAIIRNNIICNNNQLNGDGGGISLCVSAADVYNNQIYNNNSLKGGGIDCYITANHFIKNNEIFNNYSLYGSAITFQESECLVEDNNINNNTAYSSGGAISIHQSGIEVIGNQIHHNIAFERGGGILLSSCSAQNSTIHCNDIYENIAFELGDGIYSIDEDTLNAVNNWWGDESGPYNELLNPNGVGNEISGEVDFIPWSTESFFPPSSIEDNDQLPFNNSTLKQNYPNPFNPSTIINFSLQNNSKIELSVFNIKGQRIKTLVNNQLAKGNHSITWNGHDQTGKSVSSGIYYYQLKVNGKAEAVKKCLLLK